jgi:predicted ArsR family transcriptional regulator
MQETRRFILEILRERGQATVDDIVSELQKRRGNITAVTVRHHLTRLQEDELVTSPDLRRRSSPGRPQHVYSLTEKAADYFPNNYRHLAANLLQQLHKNLPPEGVNVILEGVAVGMATEARIPPLPLGERIKAVVEYLTSQGYDAHWEKCSEGYLLHTSNCPYHHIVEANETLCDMDMRLVSSLLGIVPRMMGRVAAGDSCCSYMIPDAN